MIRGYARVSTIEQDLGRQVEALRAGGCEVIYQDKMSGARRDRPELERMLREMQAGDVVVIHKLDRLGRSVRDLLEIVDEFKARGVGFRSLMDPIDTTTTTGVMVFHMFAAIAEMERGMIRDRVKHGMAYWKTQGKRYGRPVIDRSVQALEIGARLDKGEKPRDIMAAMGLTRYEYYQAVQGAPARWPELVDPKTPGEGPTHDQIRSVKEERRTRGYEG